MNLLQDLKYALRLLLKDRWFTGVAAFALALGIGVNSAVFTFVYAVLIRGLPFDHQEQIVWIGTRDAKARDTGLSFKDFQDIAASSRSFSASALWFGNQLNLSDDERAPEQYAGLYMTAPFFKVIGQRPVLGRDFTDQDDQLSATPSIIISHAIWKNRYASSPDVLGKTIKVNGLVLTVIGVMPEGFKFPTNCDLWIPFAHLAPEFRRESTERRAARNFSGIARLKPDVSISQAGAELATIGKNLQAQYPDSNKDMMPVVTNFSDRFNGGPIKTVFLSLMGAVAFVLLIACANVANLLLARSAGRAREISVRIAMGATRWRIMRQLLIESLLLSMIAGLLGLALSAIGIRLFDAATQDAGKPYWMVFRMDPGVIAFFVAVCLGTGVIFGFAPALHVSKTDLNDVLKEGGRGNAGGVRARRWTSTLIVVELALTLVLLAGAGFMMRSFLALYSMDLGIETGSLLTMRLNLPARKYSTPEVRRNFLQSLNDRMSRVPNLQAATITTNLPAGGGQTRQIQIEGHDAPATAQVPSVSLVFADTRYWETVGTKVLRGRGFDAVDGTPGHENAIINQRFAAMHFGNEDPIGRRVRISIEQSPGQPPPTRAPSWVTIVGIAPTIRQRTLEEPLPDPVLYLPLMGEAPAGVWLMVRSPKDAASLTALLREEVRALDSDLPLVNIQPMDQVLAQRRWPFRVFGTMFVIFAVIALVLAGIGLYAVTAYSVTQRTAEVGIRMALGAQAAQVRWLFVRQSLWQLAIGLAIGLAGAFGVGVILKSLLVQTGSRDPITLISIVTVLLIVALSASYWPARRATRLDPLKALRYE